MKFLVPNYSWLKSSTVSSRRTALSQSIPHSPSQFLNISFNIILQSTLIYSKSSFPMMFSYKNLARSDACCMPCPFYSPKNIPQSAAWESRRSCSCPDSSSTVHSHLHRAVTCCLVGPKGR